MTTCSTYVNQLIQSNASIVRDLAKVVAKVAPKAYIGVISNPVNSTVPIVAEVFKKAGVYDPKRLFGVTTLDTTRAATFLSGIAGSDPQTTNVPVIGGHSGVTIVPLISQAAQGDKVQAGEQYDKLVHRIQFGGDEVVQAKESKGSATLSMAYAGARFALALIEALAGKTSELPEYSYVDLSADAEGAKAVTEVIGTNTPFFSVPLTLGKNGVEKIHSLGKLSSFESEALKKAVDALGDNITKGISFKANKL